MCVTERHDAHASFSQKSSNTHQHRTLLSGYMPTIRILYDADVYFKVKWHYPIFVGVGPFA
jgi:hypothetical protein